jgi:predicted phage-related endonuclease
MNELQRTGAWFAARTGKLTASRMRAAMAYLKPKKDGVLEDKAERRNLKIEILVERMTGDIVDKYINQAMQWGIDTEPLAKAEYEVRTGRIIKDVGFIDHASIEFCGASPDGLVGDGLIEVKCPETKTHLETILSGEIPEDHFPQLILQCAVTKRGWVDFVSFDPRVDPKFQMFVRRFYPTDEQIERVESEARKFLAEVDGLFDVLSRREMIE